MRNQPLEQVRAIRWGQLHDFAFQDFQALAHEDLRRKKCHKSRDFSAMIPAPVAYAMPN